MEAMKKAFSLEPHNPHRVLSLSRIYKQYGFSDKALEILNDGLKQHRSEVAFYTELSEIHKFGSDDALIHDMKSLVSSPDLSAVQKSKLLFALAKAFDDVADYD